jgi:surfactin synthase thioesterase subunit/acyl carrier protein
MTNNPKGSALPRPEDVLPAPEAEVFVMPCSISQQRYWLLEQLSPGNTALNIPLAVQLSGPLEIPILERALNAIVARHEVLRTSFAVVDGAPKQVIKPGVVLQLGQIDLRDVAVEKRQVRIEQEMIAEAVRPLSLAAAPIFRTTLLRLTPTENVLMLTIHHIVGDGWSNGLLVREVGLFYQAILKGKPVDLPPLSVHYADYALWQEEWLKTPQFRRQLEFWKETLNGEPPVLDLPTDYPRELGPAYTAFIESLLLPAPLGDAIKRLCIDLDVTLFMVLFATYVTLLHRYTGQTEFMIGTTAANRNRSELEHLIGLFANPLILRPKFSKDMTFRELAVKLRDHSLNSFAHQEVPFEIVLEHLQERKSVARKPMIQTHFLYQKAFMEPAAFGNLTIRPLRSVSPGSTFELTYGIVERAEGIRLQMEYHTALYKKSTIRRLLRHFESLLEAAVENPDTPVSEMAMLTEEERALLEPLWTLRGPVPEGARAGIDPKSVQNDFRIQLKKHFRDAVYPHGVSIDPLPGEVLVILDQHLRLLPVGIPGTLYLGGIAPEVAGEYTLVHGPADVLSPMPLLRTDFVGQNCGDGKIEVMGHADDFARINGFRLNLRQVEAFLAHHPGVLEVAAAAFKQPSGEYHLACYIVPKPGATLSEKELRLFLKGKISDFTLPAHLVMVAMLPRDVRGEVVTELLPEPAPPAKPAPDEKIPLEAILYHQLIEIWMAILKVPCLTIEDNFFALGGSSLQALRMMTQIEKLSGRPLPLSLLLTGATIANLAHYIVQANNESAEPLVAIQPKGTRPPLFFLHGDWAGGGFYCGRLSQQLGEDQPFYVLPPYRSGKQSIFTLEEMAAYHIAAMRERTPNGPYLLGGYCIGATVAMEMTRQLQAQGEKVTHLLLIDPLSGTPWLRWAWPMIDQIGQRQKWDLQKKIHYFDLYAVSFARWIKKPVSGKITTLLRRLGIAKPIVASPITAGRETGEGVEILTHLDYAVYFLAYRLYRSKPLAVPATLYFPEETPPARLSWVRRASERAPVPFTVEFLPGDHHTCITRYTPALVAKMKKTLDSL